MDPHVLSSIVFLGLTDSYTDSLTSLTSQSKWCKKCRVCRYDWLQLSSSGGGAEVTHPRQCGRRPGPYTVASPLGDTRIMFR